MEQCYCATVWLWLLGSCTVDWSIQVRIYLTGLLQFFEQWHPSRWIIPLTFYFALFWLGVNLSSIAMSLCGYYIQLICPIGHIRSPLLRRDSCWYRTLRSTTPLFLLYGYTFSFIFIINRPLFFIVLNYYIEQFTRVHTRQPFTILCNIWGAYIPYYITYWVTYIVF